MRDSPAARFLGELKRRRVFRVLVGYLVVAWVSIQIAETTFPYLGLPGWTVTLVIVLTAAGVPLAAILAWAFDITGGGIQATAPAEDSPPAAAPDGSYAAPVAAPPLPVPLTTLVGREDELEEAERLLRGSSRLLTLTGPGGAGKTRLALEIAHRLPPGFRDGAVWVSLSSVRDPALVPPAIGAALEIGETGEEDLPTTLAGRLRDADLLLVLDNFEQVVDAAPVVSELLSTCSLLRILVTSRTPLRVRGERELPLSPLATPDSDGAGALVFASPAVRLFVERARSVNPAFEATDENVGDLAAICRRLDGLPLALELAAARAKVLSPSEILARLERRLPLLSRGARDLPAHQRTLRETIDWSHDLLKESERALFRRLAVFAGGATVDAVQAVASTDPEEDLLDLLQSLVDQSLLRAVTVGQGGSRFTMLEVIREYAAERLSAAREDDGARSRHAAHYARLAESAEAELVGPRQTRWLDRLEQEQENLREALGWLEVRDPPAALGVAVALWRFWEIRGHLTEGRRRLDALLADPANRRDGRLRIKALYAAGILADAQGDYATARRRFEESLELYREADDEWGVANALNNMGVVALRYGDHERAHRLLTESTALWRALGNDGAVALALVNLGNAARLRLDHAAARAFLRESLEMHRAAGDTNGCALTLGLLGQVAQDEGALDEAERLHEQSLERFREAGNLPQVARALLELGAIREAGSGGGDARACYGEALRAYAEVGDPRGLADSLDRLAALAGSQGDREESDRFAGAARGLRSRSRGVDVEEALERAYLWATRPRNA